MRLASRVGCSIASANEKVGRTLSLADEAAVHVAGADAQLEHDRRVARLGEREAFLHGMRTMLGRFGRGSSSHICDFIAKAWRALLHDAGAFAVILADDDQRAAGHAAGSQVGKRVGGDVGADGGLERDRAAQRIVDRRRQRRRRRCFRGAVLRNGRPVLRERPSRRPARPSGARSARPDSRPRRKRPIAAAPW